MQSLFFIVVFFLGRVKKDLAIYSFIYLFLCPIRMHFPYFPFSLVTPKKGKSFVDNFPFNKCFIK